ncbi:MAG: hypothetical protein M1840_005748 [Geoglossum simile]|nr:MAG: hypothetical protein M1840_005748 [Geoglossum simile]
MYQILDSDSGLQVYGPSTLAESITTLFLFSLSTDNTSAFDMQFTVVLGLVGLLLASNAVAHNICTDANIPTCCPNPGRRRSPGYLFSRTDKCEDGSDPCCTSHGPGPVQVSPSTSTFNLQCGKNFDNDGHDVTNGVTYSIEPCPTDTANLCLHVKGTPAPGDTITAIHLNLDDQPITTNSALGTWPFNKYCTLDGNCWVPLSAILALYGTTSLCDQKLYAAFHISVSTPPSTEGPTCFNQGTVIGDPDSHPANWFMYVTLNLECPTVCTDTCCCPPPPPPPSKKPCGAGSAYAKSDYPLNPICTHWGWYFPDVTTSGSAPLILGQTTPIGTVTWTISGTSIHWVYNVDPDYGIIEAHADIICGSNIPSHTTPPKTGDPCIPGKFTKNSGCISPVVAGQPWSGDYTCAGGHFSLIFHAKIAHFIDATSTETCNAIACPDSSP